VADVAIWLQRRRRTEGKLIVLMYHAITDAPEPDPAQLTVSKRLFADQMRWLKELGYPVVPLPVAAAQLRACTLDSPVVALTFDDGYRSVYTHALPVLASHGYPATVFLVSGAQRGVSLPDFMPARLGLLLGWSEAREMLRHGISFGAHGVTHRKLAGLPDHEVAHEVGDSKREIEDALSTMVTEFCYPFGSFDSFTDSVEAIVRGFGFTAVCANISGHNTRPGDVDRLKRLRVSWVDDSMREIGKQCLGAYNWYALYQRTRDLWCGGQP
jgi:peptidoglycan/xylan/chitin deacetylase (PgdA/CDA1 family)